MNKWVACICSVCGLKMRDEEPENGRGNRYSPQPSAEKSPGNNPAHFAAVTTTSTTRTSQAASSTITSSSRINNNNSLDAAALNYSVPRSTSERLHNGNNIHQKEPSNLSEGSGPYIPISECHTGKPGTTAKENRPSNQTPAHASSSNNNTTSNLPVPSAGRACKSKVLLADEFYDVPRSSQQPPLGSSGQRVEPPPPNWDTFPKDDKNRASSRSWSTSFDAKTNHSVRSPADSATGSGQRTRCESGPGEGENGATRISSNVSIGRSATPTAEYMNSSDLPDFSGDFNGLQGGSHNPPPRPPKPATLSRSKIDRHESTSSVSLLVATDCYDIPKTAAEKASPAAKAGSERQRRISAPRATVIPPDTKSTSQIPDILEATVQKPELSATERKTLDSYDIPVSAKVAATPDAADLLDATVALHPSTRSESGRHPYLNSAPGFKATKDSVFIYEYRPSLPTANEDPGSSFPSGGSVGGDGAQNDNSLHVSDRSPRTPNSGFSEATPPAVDRNLKPRRKGSDSDTTASPTTPNPFRLKPAPDGRRQSGTRISSGTTVRASPGSASTLPSVRSKSFAGSNNGYVPYHSPDIRQ